MIDLLLAAGLVLGSVLALRVGSARLARLRAGHLRALQDLAGALTRRGSALGSLAGRLPEALPTARASLEALGRAQRAALDALDALERDPGDERAARALLGAAATWVEALAVVDLEAAGETSGPARVLVRPLHAATRRAETRLAAARDTATHHSKRRGAQRLRLPGHGRLALAELSP